MLTHVLAIPMADELPTPNARKTCALSIWLLQVQRLPETVLIPAGDRIAFALRRGMEGELGKEGKKGSACDGLKVHTHYKERALRLICGRRLSMTCLFTSRPPLFPLSPNSYHLYWRTCWHRHWVCELRHAMHSGDLYWAALVSHRHLSTSAYQASFLPS